MCLVFTKNPLRSYGEQRKIPGGPLCLDSLSDFLRFTRLCGLIKARWSTGMADSGMEANLY